MDDHREVKNREGVSIFGDRLNYSKTMWAASVNRSPNLLSSGDCAVNLEHAAPWLVVAAIKLTKHLYA